MPDAPLRRASRLRHCARSPWAWLVLLFVISLPAVTPRLYASDEIEYFAFLRSLWFDGDLSFDNEYRYFYDRNIARAHNFHYTFLELQTVTGRRLNFGTIGCAILWAPFYGVADAAVTAARWAGSDTPRDGYARPYLRAVAYGSAVYGFLAVIVAAGVARRVIGTGRRAAMLVWIGTPLLFYMYLAPGMAHACSAFVVSVFVALWLRVRERWSIGGMAALAAVGALMVMVREQDMFLGVGPLVDVGLTLVRAVRDGRRDDVRRLAAGAGAGLVVAGVTYLPQALTYLTLYGHIGPAPEVAAKMFWSAPHALEVLFSPRHGWFFWTPLALVAVFGLGWLAWRPAPTVVDVSAARWMGCLALLMVASQVYVNGSVDTWSQSGAFGQRRFVAMSVLLALGLAQVLAATPRGVRSWGVGTVLALCVWWNLGLMAQFGAGLMDRRGLELGRNAYQTFVTVPLRLPQLAYRYAYDRASFYQQRTP